MHWKVYSDLAWTERIVSAPDDYKEETETYIKAIKEKVSAELNSILHLGCGAGGHDFHFKKHFRVTGVDLSEAMLHEAKKLNPEINYIQGDMRTINLNQKFDVVAIPDSIMYMETIDDVKRVIQTAKRHLNPEGVLLLVIHTKGEFKNNNFAYTGTDEDTHVTIFENNHIISESKYEATMVYLIRQNGHIEVHHDVHTLGLFSQDEWLSVLEENGLKTTMIDLNDLYDPFLLEDGEYKLKLFLCTYP